MACPGRRKHERFNLRSDSWWFTFGPQPFQGVTIKIHGAIFMVVVGKHFTFLLIVV